MLTLNGAKAFSDSLIRLARNSCEMKEEVKRFKETPKACFRKTIIFNFANYFVRVLFAGPTPDYCKASCEITDLTTNEVIISNLNG